MDLKKEEFKRMYEFYEYKINELAPTKEAREQLFNAVWHLQTTRNEYRNDKQNCMRCAQGLPITFGWEAEYQFPREAIPRPAYVLRVPFGEGQYDGPTYWKAQFDQHGEVYTAKISEVYPMVEFAFENPSQDALQHFGPNFGNNQIPWNAPKPSWIVPPDHYREWADYKDSSGTMDFVFSMFAQDIAEHLSTLQVLGTAITGVQHHSFKGVNFEDPNLKQPHTYQVMRFQDDINPQSKNHGRSFVVMIENGQVYGLGFYADDVPRLPIGTSFQATLQPLYPQNYNPAKGPSTVSLCIDPQTIVIPKYEFEGKGVTTVEATATVLPQPPTSPEPQPSTWVESRQPEVNQMLIRYQEQHGPCPREPEKLVEWVTGLMGSMLKQIHDETGRFEFHFGDWYAMKIGYTSPTFRVEDQFYDHCPAVFHGSWNGSEPHGQPMKLEHAIDFIEQLEAFTRFLKPEELQPIKREVNPNLPDRPFMINHDAGYEMDG